MERVFSKKTMYCVAKTQLNRIGAHGSWRGKLILSFMKDCYPVRPRRSIDNTFEEIPLRIGGRVFVLSDKRGLHLMGGISE